MDVTLQILAITPFITIGLTDTTERSCLYKNIALPIHLSDLTIILLDKMISPDSQKNKNITPIEYIDEGWDYITATMWMQILKAVGIASAKPLFLAMEVYRGFRDIGQDDSLYSMIDTDIVDAVKPSDKVEQFLACCREAENLSTIWLEGMHELFANGNINVGLELISKSSNLKFEVGIYTECVCEILGNPERRKLAASKIWDFLYNSNKGCDVEALRKYVIEHINAPSNRSFFDSLGDPHRIVDDILCFRCATCQNRFTLCELCRYSECQEVPKFHVNRPFFPPIVFIDGGSRHEQYRPYSRCSCYIEANKFYDFLKWVT